MESNSEKRPWLTAFCVAAIVLGVLGALGSVMGLIGLAAGPSLSSALPAGPAQSPAMQQAAADMQRELFDSTAPFRSIQAISGALYLLVSGGLIAAGALALRRNAAGRKVLVACFLAAALLSLVGGGVGLAVQLKTGEIIDRYMARMLAATPAAASPEADKIRDITRGVAGAGVALGMMLGVGWTLFKVGVFVGGAHYLTRLPIRELFRDEAAQKKAA